MHKNNSNELTWWKEISPENGEKVLKVIDILLTKFDLYGVNRLKPLKIPLIEFEKIGLYDFDEVINITKRLGTTTTTKLFETKNIDSATADIFKGIIENPEKEVLSKYLVIDVYSLNTKEELLEIKKDLFVVIQRYRNFFWFEGNVFVILKFDNFPLKINFNKNKTVKPSSPYYLIKALTTLIQKYGKLTPDGWLACCITQEELIECLNEYTGSTVITPIKLKSLKGNLIKKIDTDGDKLIVLEEFNIKKKGYPFKLKYPF